MDKVKSLILKLRKTVVDIANDKLAICRSITPVGRGDIDSNDLGCRIPFRSLRRPNA
jgi:hypothetical protein